MTDPTIENWVDETVFWTKRQKKENEKGKKKLALKVSIHQEESFLSWKLDFSFNSVNIATCSNPGEPAHGRRLSNDFQDGRTVAFECDGGFDLFGNKAILCSGGSWNASIPECKGI